MMFGHNGAATLQKLVLRVGSHGDILSFNIQMDIGELYNATITRNESQEHAILCNVLPSSCFLGSYNLPSFKPTINKLDLISRFS